ncbi:hypothetical protein M8C21_016276, partial [Ambrosia artemisiifolia]
MTVPQTVAQTTEQGVIANCCEGGVVSSYGQDPYAAVSAFQVSVGVVGTSNRTVKLPKNFTLLAWGFEETRALWGFFMAGTKTGATCGIVESASLPTAMAVILVAGINDATFFLIQEAAAADDCPILKTSSFVTITITSIPASESALSSFHDYYQECKGKDVK